MNEKFLGFCKWFNDQKGYGFVTTDDGQDYFVHYTGIISDQKHKTLNQGDRVEFEVVDGAKGKQAVDVVVVD